MRLEKTVSSVAASAPMVVSSQNGNFGLGIGVSISSGGSATYTVEHTFDDPEASYATDFATDAIWYDTTGLTALTANGEGNIAFMISAVRLNVTIHGSGDVKIIVLAAT